MNNFLFLYYIVMPKISNKNKNSIHININTEKKTKRKRKSNKKGKDTHSTVYVNTNYSSIPSGGILNRSPNDYPSPQVEQERIRDENKAIEKYHREHYLQSLLKREGQLNPQKNDEKIINTEMPMFNIYKHKEYTTDKENPLYDIYNYNDIENEYNATSDNNAFLEEPIWKNQNQNINSSDFFNQAKNASPVQGGETLYSVAGRRLNKDGNERKVRRDVGQARGNYTKKYLDTVKKKEIEKSLKKNYPSSGDDVSV